MLNCFQEEHNIAGLCRQARNAGNVHMRSLRSNQKISVVLNRNRDIVSCFHKACGNSSFFINVIKSKCDLNIVFIRRIYSRPFEYRHEVFFGVMNDRHFGIRKGQTSCHRGNFHIAKIGRNVVADMSCTICDVEDILNNSIRNRIIRAVVYEDNVEWT